MDNKTNKTLIEKVCILEQIKEEYINPLNDLQKKLPELKDRELKCKLEIEARELIKDDIVKLNSSFAQRILNDIEVNSIALKSIQSEIEGIEKEINDFLKNNENVINLIDSKIQEIKDTPGYKENLF